MFTKFNFLLSGVGIVLAIFLIYTSRFIPYTKITFPAMSLVPLYDESGAPKGTRLYFGDFHFHHSYIGTILILLSLPFLLVFPPISFFLIGFGITLIIDQIPELISGQWGLSVVQSIG